MSARRRRPALVVLVIAAAITCLALGWWQWQRFDSVGGSAQNLGYALQWPLFAGFFVYAYFRFVRLEADKHDDGTQRIESSMLRQTEIPPDLLPARPAMAPTVDHDPVLADYNRYLAELHARDTNRNSG